MNSHVTPTPSDDDLHEYVRGIESEGMTWSANQMGSANHWNAAITAFAIAGALTAIAAAVLAALNAISSSDGLRLSTAVVAGVSAALATLASTLAPQQRLAAARATGNVYARLRGHASYVLARWSGYSPEERAAEAAKLRDELSSLRTPVPD